MPTNPEAPFDGLHNHWEPPSPPSKWWWIMIAIVVFGALLAMMSLASAHMQHRPDLTDWLRTLYSLRSPCCDSTDAETMADPDWKLTDSGCVASEPWKSPIGVGEEFHVCVRLQRPDTNQWDWWEVPESAVVQTANRAGPALIWLYWAASGKPFIRCFLKGTLS